MLILFMAYLDNENDKQQFEKMFLTYSNHMLIYAKTLLNSSEDAEDAVHNVFLRIARKNWDTVKCIENPIDLRNYLLKATKHTAYNMIKLNKKDNVSIDTVIEYSVDDSIVISDDEFVDAICKRTEYEQVIKAINSLSDTYKDVIYYHFVLELPVIKTAHLLGQTVCATQKQLVRGKKLLLNQLGITQGDKSNGNK